MRIISKEIVHTPLIDDDTFARTQDSLRSRVRSGPAPGVKRTRNTYLLRGALQCGVCGRTMQGHWSHHQAYYRCRFPEQYALANRITHPRNVYLREAWLIRPLDDWLAKIFSPHRLDETVDLMAAATQEVQDRPAAPTPLSKRSPTATSSSPPTVLRLKQAPTPRWSLNGSLTPRPAARRPKPNSEPPRRSHSRSPARRYRGMRSPDSSEQPGTSPRPSTTPTPPTRPSSTRSWASVCAMIPRSKKSWSRVISTRT
ncbi:zinc ribbon domain-containing protein [Streptomyces sp. AA1529]|uniref:zinc ribbon domain-containing protein n=1 Tax=Streptomyces sp. AA1529 TaxID=1203257 RepID=UPI003D713F5B